ncbi:MAG TPA: type II toxin-antitoxin system HipA family toxin [Usitatibacteraceae bacterium]|nr:type II toxin-antitoxin system HipA family toxin [Usitatibacteraceae bacterium]HRA22451.1 type II toxin-antitoxin system HipA family toxin [Usitatibacteraceae bacterium]
MELSVYVLDRIVATLESMGDFKSVLTYRPETAKDDFVSLTMRVRAESWTWPDTLPPVFQMNLPEGYLLQVLQERFGPAIGADPIKLLSIVGRNMIGRLRVVVPGVPLDEAPKPVDVAQLMTGDHSEERFLALVREHATSGISGIQPKFLDEESPSSEVFAKGSLRTRKHIIKGSAARLPFLALNEHLCMRVAAKVTETARTEISPDGRLLIVHRFDVDENGQPFRGMEDFCALLGLRPANKYETTWERVCKAVKQHVPGESQKRALEELATHMLLAHALRNADQHAKNIALVYTSDRDVHVAPSYDLFTTAVYEGYHLNPPALSLMGTRTWTPGKSLRTALASVFGLAPREQAAIVEKVSEAATEVAPEVRQWMRDLPAFEEIGTRLLRTWNDGLSTLRNDRHYSLGAWDARGALEGLTEVPPLGERKVLVGRSPVPGF